MPIPSRPQSQPPLISTLGHDLRHVADEVRRRGLRHALSLGFSGLETFYLTDEDRRLLATLPRYKRVFVRLWWFVLSLLMKLTPTRRILLAAALVLMVLRTGAVNMGSVHLTLPLSIVGGALVLVVLMLELKDKRVARSELEAGRVVQLALMPGRSPAIPGWQAWLYTEPANDVGGDLVDHLQIDDTRHFVVLGDVSGKALPAALLSVKLQATLRALAPRFDDLGALGAALNEILFRDGLPSRFASLAYLELDDDFREGARAQCGAHAAARDPARRGRVDGARIDRPRAHAGFRIRRTDRRARCGRHAGDLLGRRHRGDERSGGVLWRRSPARRPPGPVQESRSSASAHACWAPSRSSWVTPCGATMCR